MSEAEKTQVEEPLKVPTEADMRKKREEETDALIAKEEPFEIGNKIIWVEELAMKDRLKLDKLYMKIMQRGFNIYNQYINPTEQNTEGLMKQIEKDLEDISTDDIEFLMIALVPSNPSIAKSDLLELKPSQLRKLFDKILEINGISEALKKAIPSNLKSVLQ